MIRINVHEAKVHLSRYLDLAAGGERVIVCRRNVPIAELRPISAAATREPRPIGLDAGRFEVPASFFEPLPPEFVDAFEGQGA